MIPSPHKKCDEMILWLRGRVADLEAELALSKATRDVVSGLHDYWKAEAGRLVAQRGAARALLPEPLADGVMVWPAPASEVIESIRAALSGAVPVPEDTT